MVDNRGDSRRPRDSLLPIDLEVQIFRENRHSLLQLDATVGKFLGGGDPTGQFRRHIEEDLQLVSGREVPGYVRHNHPRAHDPGHGTDQGDLRQAFRTVPGSQIVPERGDRSPVRQELVRPSRGQVERDTKPVEPRVHLEQDEVYVHTDARLREGIRRLFRLFDRGREHHRVEGRVHQIHERRDSHLRVRRRGELDEGQEEQVLRVREGGDHFRIVGVHQVLHNEGVARKRVHPAQGQVDQERDLGFLHRSGERDDQDEGGEGDSEAGHDPADDGIEGKIKLGKGDEHDRHMRPGVRLLLRRFREHLHVDVLRRLRDCRERRHPEEIAERDRPSFGGSGWRGDVRGY